MITKNAAWYQALSASSVEWRYGLDILAADEATLLEDPSVYDQSASDRLVPRSARITLDVTARTHRSFALSLRNADGRYLPGIKGYPSGGKGSPTATGLIWYNTRYRPWIDLRTGFDVNGNKVYDRTYLGIYVLTQPQAQVKPVGTVMAINLLDKSALLCKPYLISNASLPTFTKNSHTVGGYASGQSFDNVMSDLATRAGIPTTKQLFEPSALNLPADYAMSEGTDWWEHLQRLAGSLAHVIYFDGTGNLVRRADPLIANLPSAYTFAPGAQSIASAVVRTTDLSNTFNHIVVAGGSSQTPTVRGSAQVQDPASPYHSGNIGDRVVYVGKDGKLDDMTPDPTIGSTAQANTRAKVILARHLGQQETVDITCRNIPALEPYDRFTVNVPQSGLNIDFLAQKFTWQLAHDGMTVNGTRWFTVGS